MDDVFVIDTKPDAEEYREDVPQYQTGRKSLELSNSEKTTLQKTRPVFFNPCWNCGKTTHNIRDCPAQNNSITVEWYRELMVLKKNNQTRNQQGSGRYHDNENTEKYKHLTLGMPSKNLRKILGLPDGHLPSYICRLRHHGYPKAWLKYATVKPHGLNLYDAHGNEIAEPNIEDGEVQDEEDKLRYDMNKLIEFPGFNVPAPPDTIDNYEKIQALPFSEDQSLLLMIESLKEKALTEYCLTRENNHTSISAEGINNSQTSMETDIGGVIVNDSSYGSIPPSEVLNVSGQPDMDGDCSSTPTCQGNLVSTPVKKSPSGDSLGRILSSAEGTPILQSKSGYARLPPVENFSKNISDVINFENLPESVGTYEKMRKLLKRIKEVVRGKTS